MNYPTIDVNLTALMKSTRLAIAAFLKQSKPKDGGPLGVIVNTTSVAGVFPCFPAPVYAASKWGTILPSILPSHPCFELRLLTVLRCYGTGLMNRCHGLHKVNGPFTSHNEHPLLRISPRSIPNPLMVRRKEILDG
jgi:hypothetical protein